MTIKTTEARTKVMTQCPNCGVGFGDGDDELSPHTRTRHIMDCMGKGGGDYTTHMEKCETCGKITSHGVCKACDSP